MLDETNFYHFVLDKETDDLILDKPWFILFFSPGCPHCVHFKPDWKEFHGLHKDEINIASVDCQSPAGRTVCGLFFISGYPSLKYFPVPGPETDYYTNVYSFKGSREISNLEKFALKEGYKQFEPMEIHEVYH